MANYNTNHKPPRPSEVYPTLMSKLVKASYHVTELRKILGSKGLSDELGVSPQSIQERSEKAGKSEK